MKKGLLGCTILLLVLAMVVSCTKAPPTPTTTTVTGKITEVTVTGPGEGTVFVDLDTAGVVTYPITAGTDLLIGGKECSLAYVDLLQAGGATLNCSIVYDANGNTVEVNITNPPNLGSTTGTITDVNPGANTITVQTATGTKTYKVDPKTGIVIGGEVCTCRN